MPDSGTILLTDMTISQSEHRDLTPEEEEFLENFGSMKEADRAAMLRVAQYFVAHPEGTPNTMEEMRELLEQAKRLQ